MINSEIITQLSDSLTTKLSATKRMAILQEIDGRIGTLASPGKMPWYSWSISADHCNTGSKLAKIPGTPCSFCYAQKGRYRFGVVKNALERRLDGFTDPDWWKLMAIRLNILAKQTPEYFRWFDSGDLQSLEMLEAICNIARYTPGIQHWLPTQERALVAQIPTDKIPNSLLLRISAAKTNGVVKGFPFYSTVSTNHESEGSHQCPARQQQNKCAECRACWQSTVPAIKYPLH